MSKRSILTIAAVIVIAALGYAFWPEISGAGRGGGAAHTEADAHAHGDVTFCGEHHVPEELCPFCRPELLIDLGWCAGHDIEEALCTRCNPEIINCIFYGNHSEAGAGGAIGCQDGGSVTVVCTDIFGNADGDGRMVTANPGWTVIARIHQPGGWSFCRQ